MPTFAELFPNQKVKAPVGYKAVEVYNVTAPQTLDTILATDSLFIEWDVIVWEEGTNNIETRIYRVVHNGLTGDATLLEQSEYGHQSFGAQVTGLSLNATLTGSGVSQQINLIGTATNPTNFKLHRRSIG